MKRCVLVAALLCGCPPTHVERPYPPPTADELLSALRARAEKLRSLRASTKIDHLGPGAERVKVRVDLWLARGGRLRLEALHPLDETPLSTLVSDGQRF